MKHPALLAMAFVAMCCCFVPASCIKEDLIIDMLEQLRMRMCHPIPALGLPALDPFQISHMESSMNNKYLIDFTGSVTNFSLTGLSDFIINDLKITVFPLQRFTFDITFPLTALKSLYTAKGSIAYILNLAGNGNAKASVDQVRIIITSTYRLGTSLSIRNFKLKITIGGLEIDFENLIEEERVNDFFHALVNELGLELLDDVWQEENAMVEELIQTKLNNILGNYSLGDLIGIIGGGGEGSDEPIFGPDVPADCKDDVKLLKVVKD